MCIFTYIYIYILYYYYIILLYYIILYYILYYIILYYIIGIHYAYEDPSCQLNECFGSGSSTPQATLGLCRTAGARSGSPGQRRQIRRGCTTSDMGSTWDKTWQNLINPPEVSWGHGMISWWFHDDFMMFHGSPDDFRMISSRDFSHRLTLRSCNRFCGPLKESADLRAQNSSEVPSSIGNPWGN